MQDSFSWGPIPISPEEIEATLSELWTRDPLAGASRLCTTNLLVFLKDKGQETDTHVVLAKLAATNPGRAVLIAPVPGQRELQAYVAARCELPPDRSSMVCCDQILIEGDSTLLPRAMSLLPDILVPELPVFGWWRGDIPPVDQFPSELLRGLLARLIFDSREFTTWASLSRARRLGQALACPVGDLNWCRLRPWRTAALSALTAEEASTVRREFHTLHFTLAQGGNLVQPLLFAGWVAALLGMEPASAVQDRLRIDIRLQDGSSLHAAWDLQEAQGLPEGTLLGIQLVGIGHTLDIRRTDTGCLECTAELHGHRWQSVLSPVDSELHQLLSVELSRFGMDEELERSLDLALRTLELLGTDLG